MSNQNIILITKEIYFNNSEIFKNFYEDQFPIRNIYTCGWGFEKDLHAQFFPEHRKNLNHAIQLNSLKPLANVMESLRNATKDDLLISGGVHGCIQNELRVLKKNLNQEQWNLWLRDNFKGTYIVCK